VCQENKYDTTANPGLLQPLPIPQTIWQHITMDFIKGLLNSKDKQVIFVVVDQPSTTAHFMALTHPYTTRNVVQAFLDNVFRFHGFMETITSDRDSFFCEPILSRIYGSTRGANSTFHKLSPPNIWANQSFDMCLKTYLGCMCVNSSHKWVKWLPLVEWWYNHGSQTR